MKVFKSKPDEYGWFLQIHLLKFDNCLRIERKKRGNENSLNIDIWEENDIKVLEKALKERKKQKKEKEK